MTGLAVREAEERDTPGVRQLCVQLNRCDYLLGAWGRWMRTPGDLNLVAESEGRIVGCVHAGLLSPAETFLQGLRVDPAMRRRGVGSRLMAELAERLRRRGLAVQRAVTAQGNGPARRLLAALGWREVHSVARRRRRSALTVVAGLERPPLAWVAEIVGRQPMVASRPGLAFFRRIYFAASAASVAEAVAAGHVLGTGDACSFLDPPGKGHLWLHSLVGPASSSLRLLAGLMHPGAGGRGTLIVEAPAEVEIQNGLDTLGFEPAGLHDRYLVLEAPTGAIGGPRRSSGTTAGEAWR
jgi:N-acetylglutamate synthase-like GNAT family acetyltransferase